MQHKNIIGNTSIIYGTELYGRYEPIRYANNIPRYNNIVIIDPKIPRILKKKKLSKSTR